MLIFFGLASFAFALRRLSVMTATIFLFRRDVQACRLVTRLYSTDSVLSTLLNLLDKLDGLGLLIHNGLEKLHLTFCFNLEHLFT